MSEHELWNEMGNLYFLAGFYDHAVHAYDRAIELRPETGEPYSNLALTYVQMGKYSEASDHYLRGIQLLEDELDKAVSLYKLGDVYLHLKQFAQAAETYQKTEELVPDLGQIVESSKPSDLLLHCPPVPVPLQQVDAEREDSFGLENSQFMEELTPWWFEDQVEPDNEPDYDFWYIDESGVHVSNEIIMSTESLTWQTEQNSQPDLIDEEQQTANGGEENLEEQNMEDINQAQTINETAEQEIHQIGEENQLTDDSVAATASGTLLVITDEPEIMTVSPEFSIEDMTDPEAVQYDTAIECQENELSDTERAEIVSEIGKFKRVLEINPRNAFAWDTLGGNYKNLGQYEDAIEAYQKAVSLDASKAFYFHHLGLVYAAVGRYEEAVNAFEKVIEVDPNHSLAHATLGGYYRKNGNEALAKEHIEKARNLISNDENEYNRACMEAICGNTDYSLELLELALKNKQAYVNWARKDPDLDFIRSDPRFLALLTEYAVKPA